MKKHKLLMALLIALVLAPMAGAQSVNFKEYKLKNAAKTFLTETNRTVVLTVPKRAQEDK